MLKGAIPSEKRMGGTHRIMVPWEWTLKDELEWEENGFSRWRGTGVDWGAGSETAGGRAGPGGFYGQS